MATDQDATTAFEKWWTSCDTDSWAGQLALASPAAKIARDNFQAGWEAACRSERQRIIRWFEDECIKNSNHWAGWAAEQLESRNDER